MEVHKNTDLHFCSDVTTLADADVQTVLLHGCKAQYFSEKISKYCHCVTNQTHQCKSYKLEHGETSMLVPGSICVPSPFISSSTTLLAEAQTGKHHTTDNSNTHHISVGKKKNKTNAKTKCQ